jgi:hypothetical protein
MIRSTKLLRALQLRNAGLSVIRCSGMWQACGGTPRSVPGAGSMRFLTARTGTLWISCRTPFQRIPHADDDLKYRAVQYGLTVPKNLPYGLDVWAPKKVLNIEWDNSGNVALVSMRRGSWETELISAARSH